MKRFSTISVSVVSFVLSLLAGLPAKADSIPTVTYTVSGSSGAWTLDFSVTNNTGQDLYFFAVQLPTANITASPAGWFAAGPATSFVGLGTYQDSWEALTVAILPGATLNGFEALDTATASPATI